MIIWLVRLVLNFRRMVASDYAPRQLALGCTLGLVMGLVPKGNLLAVAIAIVVLSLRLNLVSAMLSTLVFSFVGPWLDPITHRIGFALLGNESLTSFWTTVYQYPLIPWTYFNNTVVFGSLVLGVAISGPFYFLSKATFGRLRRSMASTRDPVVAPN